MKDITETAVVAIGILLGLAHPLIPIEGFPLISIIINSMVWIYIVFMAIFILLLAIQKISYLKKVIKCYTSQV
jgi:hypothetical protein